MTTDFADVTVIVPAYQAASTIGRVLSSVAAQTIKPRAVVVVDDGSDDLTLEAAEACRDMLGDIELTVIRQDTKAPARRCGRGRAYRLILSRPPSDISRCDQ